MPEFLPSQPYVDSNGFCGMQRGVSEDRKVQVYGKSALPIMLNAAIKREI